MKKLSLLLLALGTVSFTACSSLDVNKAESLEENYPKDFVAADYMALHPGLRSLQIQDFVSQHNKGLSLEKDSIANDSAAFFADTSILHKIYVSPFYAGYTEEMWSEDWSFSISENKVCKEDTISVRVKQADSVPVKVFLGKLSYDSEGKIIAVEGFTDSLKTPESAVTYTIDGVVNSIVNQRGSTVTVTDTNSCVIVLDSAEGGIPKDKRRQLLKFNFHGITDDLAALAAVPVDTFAISSQYLVFGQSHGWAYRTCLDSEKDNPVQSEVYPMKKLYCADGDVIREIAK